MGRLSFLDPIKHCDGSISTSNFGNILPVHLPDFAVRAHSSRIIPSNTRYQVRILRGTMAGLNIHFTTEDLTRSRRVYGRPVSEEIEGNFGIIHDDHGLPQHCDGTDWAYKPHIAYH